MQPSKFFKSWNHRIPYFNLCYVRIMCLCKVVSSVFIHFLNIIKFYAAVIFSRNFQYKM